MPMADNGEPQRLVLLHGDNGSGKTTILRLVWNTLSAADDKGHRSFIARTPFRKLVIRLADGSVVRVVKVRELVGDFQITLQCPDQEELVATYEFDERRMIVSRRRHDDLASLELMAWHQDRLARAGDANAADVRETEARLRAIEESRLAERRYFAFLEDVVGMPLFLADDRTLYSDDPEIHRNRERLRGREDPDHLVERLSRLVFIELQVAMNRVNDLIRGLTIGGQNDGSANSNAIYAAVLRQLASSPTRPSEDSKHEPALDQLARIAKIAPGFEEFGLVPPFDAADFRQLLSYASERPLVGDLAEQVISPYLSSLSARYAALQEAHDLLQALVPTTNDFLSEKQMRFTPRGGLSIATSDNEPLGVDSLSSGERQLLMLLCTTIHARVDTRLFIIDEPELSLGVEWQRKILDVLLELTEGTGLQFLVATHSIEIISARPASLVQLRAI